MLATAQDCESVRSVLPPAPHNWPCWAGVSNSSLRERDALAQELAKRTT